jgi:hypothetical protein
MQFAGPLRVSKVAEAATRTKEMLQEAKEIVKTTKKESHAYSCWMSSAGCHPGGKPRKAYPGSCRKMGRAEALRIGHARC